VHAAPATFSHQGWIAARDLTVVAPGLPEAEVMPNGTIAVTLLRAVGYLARFDLASRPLPAGPEMPVPGAQLHTTLTARLALLEGCDPAGARDVELGLRATIGGAASLLAGASLLELRPSGLLLSALKPAARGPGFVVRVLNPTDAALGAELAVGVPFHAVEAVRLDEEPDDWPVASDERTVRFAVPAHALRSVRLTP
jgi:alpha-mannosidase/mannosylglycerate hydrolase